MKRDWKGIKRLELPQIVAIAILILFLVVVEWFVVSSLAKNHLIRRNEAVMRKAEETDAQQYNEAVEVQSQTIGNTVFTVSYPTVDQKIVEPIQKELDVLLEKAKEQYKDEAKRTWVYLKVYQSNVLSGVKDVYYYQSVYQETKKGLEQVAYDELGHQLEGKEKSGTAVISELFINDLEVTNHFVKKAMNVAKEQSLSEEQTNQLLKEFAYENWKNLDASIIQNGFRFNLKEPIQTSNGENLTQISFAFQELFPILKSDRIPESQQEAYENWKNQLEERLNEKRVAISFDDGPSSELTPKVLDILKRYGVHATFYIMGKHVPGNEDIIKQIVEQGHQVGNHSYSHPLLTTLTPEGVHQQVADTQKLIGDATGGIRPTTLRPPYGGYNRMVAEQAGIAILNWSVDTLDWKSRNVNSILQEVREGTYNGSIILMHDIHPETVEALPGLLDFLKQEGYAIGSIEELMGGQAMLPNHVYFDRKSHKEVQ